MSNGKTLPALFSCERASAKAASDYVVKLRGGIDYGSQGLLCELYASILAAHLGISCPSPAIVLIELDLAEAIAGTFPDDDRRANVVLNSVGLNFGSQFLTNLVSWPVDKKIPEELQAAAMKVFAFDALIQNADRTFQNPNLGIRGGDLFVYDHETAFSFLLGIFPSQTPWMLGSESYLEKHVFRKALKGVPFPDSFLLSLLELTREKAKQISSLIPTEWNSANLQKIESHLVLVNEHAAEFSGEVMRRLA